jgi:osmoprotectant transport system ATP-binding protein
MNNKSIIVEIENLHAAYGAIQVLKEISLKIREGELLSLVGTSGSGKTTLLRSINGMVRPSQGVIRVLGSQIPYSSLPRFRRKLGYVIQKGGLFPHLTVEKNISILGIVERIPKAEMRERVVELLKTVKLQPDKVIHKKPRELSGGQAQRVAFARALFLDPPILLMDEPFGALDPITRRDIQEEFKEWMSEFNKTVVLVTHDLNEAFFLADEIAVMDKGKILQLGDREEIENKPKDPFVKRFVEASSSVHS